MIHVRGHTMTNFLHWLTVQHPEVRELRSLPEGDLLQFVNEFEQGKLDNNHTLRRKWQSGFFVLFRDSERVPEDYKQAKEELKRLEIENTVLEFEDWLKEEQTQRYLVKGNNLDTLLHKYLDVKQTRDIDRYIGSIKSLRNGRVYDDLTELLARMGVKPKIGKRSSNMDILERYRSVPLHTIFLYTTEDQSIGSYISENWGALDTLSGEYCDIHPTVDQFRNAEDAYDFIEKLDVIRNSNFNAYSQLPGLFFWDNQGVTEYIPFGSKATSADIRDVVRVVFEEIRKKPTISSVKQAKNLLSSKNLPEIKEGVVKKAKANVWPDLLAILIAFIIVIVVVALISIFVSPFVLAIVFITALLFFVLITVWLLRRADELSESNFTKLVNRFFDALPLLREKSDNNKNESNK